MKTTTEDWRSRKFSAETTVLSRTRTPSFAYDSFSDVKHFSKTSDLRIEATLHRQISCNSRCLCHCHKTYFARTPKLTQDIIGSLFIGYSNTPINRKPCNEKLCKQQRSSLLKVSYFFPSWFCVHRMVAFKNIWNPNEGHQISVRTPRVVHPFADVFLVADHGNLDSLKKLFSEGLASPFDIHGDTGQSVLQRAVIKGRTDFCEFLLANYADPEIEDMHGNSPLDRIWDQYLINDKRPSVQALQQLFSSRLDASSDLQKRNFTVLHQIVLHLNPLDLESVLRISTADIDARCSNGRTPLVWAILRSQTEDIRLLLEYGADVTIADNLKSGPLHIACRNPSIEILELILSALSSSQDTRPNLNLPNIIGRTPFHGAIFHDLQDIARTLLAHCTTEETNYMIELTAGKFGSGPFHLSIQVNSHSCLKLLLSLGCRTDGVDPIGLNLLHLAAVCGDLETITILRDAAIEGKISGCSIDARDSYGYTPLEDFDIVRRKYVGEDDKSFEMSRGVFLDLLQNVSGAGENDLGDEVGRLEEIEEDDSDDEEFFDAC